jgi:hypothetical protein
MPIGTIVAIVLVVLGLGFLSAAVQAFFRARAARAWTRVSARVVDYEIRAVTEMSSEEDDASTTADTRYYPILIYQYEADGGTHTGRYDAHPGLTIGAAKFSSSFNAVGMKEKQRLRSKGPVLDFEDKGTAEKAAGKLRGQAIQVLVNPRNAGESMAEWELTGPAWAFALFVPAVLSFAGAALFYILWRG